MIFISYSSQSETSRRITAIVNFQNSNGLTPDGQVGPSTRQKLMRSNTNEVGNADFPLKEGDSGDKVTYLQYGLRILCCSPGSIDGSFGSGTTNAVKKFQAKYNLTADGIVGGGTWSKIFSVYKVSVSGSGVTKMVNVAKHELAWAFKEDNGNNITPYGEWYGMNGSAWCAMFVSWCAMQAGILGTKVPKYAYCPSGVLWYRNKGKYYSRNSSYIPRIGDTIFFWNTSLGRVGHTGIVIATTATTVTTIEGNTNDGVGTHTYNKTNTYIDGYGCNDGSYGSSSDSTTTEPVTPTSINEPYFNQLEKVYTIALTYIRTHDTSISGTELIRLANLYCTGFFRQINGRYKSAAFNAVCGSLKEDFINEAAKVVNKNNLAKLYNVADKTEIESDHFMASLGAIIKSTPAIDKSLGDVGGWAGDLITSGGDVNASMEAAGMLVDTSDSEIKYQIINEAKITGLGLINSNTGSFSHNDLISDTDAVCMANYMENNSSVPIYTIFRKYYDVRLEAVLCYPALINCQYKSVILSRISVSTNISHTKM